MPDKEYALIVAAGAGTRMKSEVPKQFMPVNGTPILMYTIFAFYKYSPDLTTVLVLSEKDHDRWKKLCRKHQFTIPLKLATGGETRFQSVKNGLNEIGDTGLVAIHDGVRPLVDQAIIAASYNLAALHGCAIASVRLKESLRIVDKDQTQTVDRSKYRLIQTPQTFRIPIIKEAYKQPENHFFTDDASVAEKAGYKISLFEGNYKNIKITTPDDLLFAGLFLK
jgi:2-C-methyl-D-erythritol 4-phosphate cytidylyltransferase